MSQEKRPEPEIGLLADVDRKDFGRIAKGLAELRLSGWDSLPREYRLNYGIPQDDRENQLRQSERDIRARVKAYPGGQSIALVEGMPCGMIGSILTDDPYGDWNEVTGKGTYSTHNPLGKVCACCELTTSANGISKLLINDQRERAAKAGIKTAVAKTRPGGALEYMLEKTGMFRQEFLQCIRTDMDLFMELMADYIKPIDKDGKSRQRSPVLNMHYSNGATISPDQIEFLTRPVDYVAAMSTLMAIYQAEPGDLAGPRHMRDYATKP